MSDHFSYAPVSHGPGGFDNCLPADVLADSAGFLLENDVFGTIPDTVEHSLDSVTMPSQHRPPSFGDFWNLDMLGDSASALSSNDVSAAVPSTHARSDPITMTTGNPATGTTLSATSFAPSISDWQGVTLMPDASFNIFPECDMTRDRDPISPFYLHPPDRDNDRLHGCTGRPPRNTCQLDAPLAPNTASEDVSKPFVPHAISTMTTSPRVKPFPSTSPVLEMNITRTDPPWYTAPRQPPCPVQQPFSLPSSISADGVATREDEMSQLHPRVKRRQPRRTSKEDRVALCASHRKRELRVRKRLNMDYTIPKQRSVHIEAIRRFLDQPSAQSTCDCGGRQITNQVWGALEELRSQYQQLETWRVAYEDALESGY
ncbi:hypothetical protein A1O7_06969 [Cladophialophora yegresii CBS 114405]|uniref:Uncharacterized protein n=1 Tax=Cladophialophora yegresii CBS 114405 TaxID=1182544 RepID=W9VUC6_9EURO|nr:uncharacterized protein A1O7_06969 [Cladophialophora yegresii CBS 114405]EXJ56625.1 hypothetical protein A1O7_06969 [Cladophialophora yegresii CBS 114405]